MKHLRILGLMALSAGALLLPSGTAMATSLTSPTGTIATPTIQVESEGRATADLKQVGALIPAECNWVVEGAVAGHGEGKPSVVSLEAIAISGCTMNWHLTAVTPGKLEITRTSGYDGTVTWTGATFHTTRFGVSCYYKTENTHLGTITGGSPATIDVEGSLLFHSGGAVCGEPGHSVSLTGSYVFSSPSSLFVDESGTAVTSPTGTIATPAIKAESEGHVAIDHPLASFQCQWAFEGAVEGHSAGNAVVSLSSLSTTGCTDSWHATTATPGKLEVITTSGYDGALRWSGGTVEMTRLGTTCRYKAEGVNLGTLTGGSPATIDIEGKIAFHSGSPLCGEEAQPLTGSLKVSSPASLFVDRA